MVRVLVVDRKTIINYLKTRIMALLDDCFTYKCSVCHKPANVEQGRMWCPDGHADVSDPNIEPCGEDAPGTRGGFAVAGFDRDV
jgi:hypothetical protein